MRVLCAIGNRGAPEIVQRVAERLSPEFELLLLHPWIPDHVMTSSTSLKA